MKVDGRCQVCGDEGESILHILFQCTAARHVWALFGIPRPETAFEEGSLLEQSKLSATIEEEFSWRYKSLKVMAMDPMVHLEEHK